MLRGMDADAPALSINCRGELLDLSVPVVMGILNLSQDSFYGPSAVAGEKMLLDKADVQLSEGAAILDIGAMTSKPGSTYISPEEEWKLLEPALKSLRKQFPRAILSIDTHRKATAERCLDLGADIINDITGGDGDSNMFALIAERNCPYIMMHMQGNPQTMQKNPEYEDVTREVLDYFIKKLGVLREMGAKDVVLDPGFGFGKTLSHNYQLLRELKEFSFLECPILAGMSRKSMINKVLGTSPAEALNGTTALNMVALMGGAHILRVHDVKEAVQCVQLYEALKNTDHDPSE